LVAAALEAVGDMNPHAFLRQLHTASIEAAIQKAEARTSGEIRVYITRHPCEDPVTAAQRQFDALGMAATRLHNAVLLFIAPASQTFAIIGDKGVHDRCGDIFWTTLRTEMTAYFKDRHYLQAILHGIARAGEMLAVHFPPDPAKPHELSNDVAHD
jgi:uncharacterized membrane protein